MRLSHLVKRPWHLVATNAQSASQAWSGLLPIAQSLQGMDAQTHRKTRLMHTDVCLQSETPTDPALWLLSFVVGRPSRRQGLSWVYAAMNSKFHGLGPPCQYKCVFSGCMRWTALPGRCEESLLERTAPGIPRKGLEGSGFQWSWIEGPLGSCQL